MSTVPFYPQSWDLTKWRELGFASEDDARYWEKSCCGILCLQMALGYFYGLKTRTVDLIEEGRSIGAYTDANGWSHAGLVELAGLHKIEAERGNYSLEQIQEIVKNGGLAIVSIKWGFRGEKGTREKLLFWKKYGGHLALVVGATLDGVYVHHTSIRPGYDWENKFVGKTDFERGYTGRAIILNKPSLTGAN